LRITFFGSGGFAVPSLRALLQAGHQVGALVCQPDREKGRGRVLAPPPTKPVALASGVRVLQPRRVKDEDQVALLRTLGPDLQVVVAYGQILSRTLLDIPRLGTVNVHGSLLPAYRGAAPVQWAVARGESETGVTTMLVDEGLDTGPLLLRRATPVGPDETAPALEARLAALGAELLLETVAGLGAGALTPMPQDHERATLAPLLRKEDGLLDWSWAAERLARHVRAFQPWPGSAVRGQGRTIRILGAGPAPGTTSEEPGTIVAVAPPALIVAAGGGTLLRVDEVQPESRNVMAAAAFAAGARLLPGQRFG
jgi:methionyl-tRNA formyltransferase